MKRINSEELDSLDEYSAVYEGAGLTGYAVELEPGIASYRSFVQGVAWGPEYSVSDDGVLLSYSNISTKRPIVGAFWVWDYDGNLQSEEIFSSNGHLALKRKWKESGLLASEELIIPRSAVGEWGGEEIIPWVRLPVVTPPENVLAGQFTATVKSEDLSEAPGSGQQILNGSPFTGFVFDQGAEGGSGVRSMIEGFEEGPVFQWSASGRVVGQGVRRHPYGPVGPWHEWDEQGRLLSETVFDALGNRIIRRELDESQNIVREQRFEPTTLSTDPETGERRPAPWL